MPRRTFAGILLLVALVSAHSALAQAPAAPAVKPTGTGVIEGTVLKAATGEPLRGARVELMLNSREAMMEGAGHEDVTDETGKFSFTELAAGTYSLSVSRAGYVTQNYGERGGGLRMFGMGGTPLNLTAGQKMTELQFRMVAGGVITGRVYDRYGDPVEGAAVSAQKPGAFTSNFMGDEGGATTNDLGEYRVYGLAPGEYVVVATPGEGGGGFLRMARRMMGSGNRGQTTSDGQKEAAGKTYFPGVTEGSRATRLQVKAGEEISGIDIPIQTVRVYAVRGRVNIPAGLKGDNVRLMMIRTDGGIDMGRGTTAKADGSFEIEGVAPGKYRVMAMGMDPEKGAAGMATANQEVIVSGSDVEGVNITLGGGGLVTGMLRIEGTREIPKYTTVMLMDKDGVGFSGGGSAQVKEDGIFEMKGVSGGTYTVTAHAGMQNDKYYLKEVRLGSQDVRESLNVSSGGVAGLEILIGADGGTVSGRALTEESLPSPGAMVMLLPSDEKRIRIDAKHGQADQHGRFVVPGVRPGDYRLVALEELDPSEFMGLQRDEEFAAKFKDKGVTVRVSASGQHALDVTVTKPKK